MDTKPTKPEILTVPAFEDFRGYLAVPYDQSINFTVRQINQGYSKKAFTLRGLHFQEGEHALDTLLQDTRLNRRRMQGAVRIIQQMINREL